MSVLAFAIGGIGADGVAAERRATSRRSCCSTTAARTGQWWWDLVIQAGGFFTTSYVLLVLAHALWPADEPVRLNKPVSRLQEAAALALALCSMLLGLATIGPVPLATLSLTPKDLWSAILLVLGGGVLALGLGHRLPPCRWVMESRS